MAEILMQMMMLGLIQCTPGKGIVMLHSRMWQLHEEKKFQGIYS